MEGSLSFTEGDLSSAGLSECGKINNSPRMESSMDIINFYLCTLLCRVVLSFSVDHNACIKLIQICGTHIFYNILLMLQK